MKTLNTFRILLATILLAVFFVLPFITKAQCRTDLLLGQNIVTNGDFSQSYTGWTYTADSDGDLNTGPDGYKQFTGGFSVPGNIYVGTGADMFGFNNAFNKPFNGHTTGAASDKFLMVDGVCVTGIKLWRQTNIPVVANTRYYFSVWINSLKDQPNYPGLLNFDVNGFNLVDATSALTVIQAPNLGGGSVGGAWVRVTAYWDSGPTPPATATISIEGSQTVGCGGASGESDFAIDDISFVPGCSFGDPGPQPDLGPDQTLCGKGGSITLDANVPHLASTTVTWSDGTTGTGLAAPYTKVITTPGTYSVCVVDGSSCIKSDVIVITNTFSINIGGPYTFCSSASQLLDAGFTGIGTTYKWYKGGILVPYPNDTKTYTATTAGTYTVDVTVPGCGTQSSSATITTTAPVTPVDAYFCATSGPVSGVTLGATNANSANLSWFTTATGGTAIASGVTTPNGTTSQYAVPTIAMGTTATQTYYVQDNTYVTGTVGPTTEFATGTASDMYPGNAQVTGGMCGGGCSGQNGIYFSPTQAFNLNSVQIPIRVSNQNTGVAMTITSVVLRVYTSAGVATAAIATSTNASVVIPGVNSATFSMYTFTFSNFTIDPTALGTSNLLLKVETLNTNYELWRYQMENRTGLTSPYPYASTITPNAVNITSSLSSNSNTTTQYFGIYNWNISARTPCSRTPVRAISNCVTPVTWTSFYLVPRDNNSCKLVWSTADETNNSYFAVERSVDGINFETIATVSGAGNRDIASNYFYVDNAPLSGTSYYRITQHDYDGKFSSTAMKPYSSEGLVTITTYPNPFQNSTTLLVSGADAETYTYSLYSVSGQLVEQGSGTINQTQTIGETAAKGMYMLTVVTSTDISTSKIVKQ